MPLRRSPEAIDPLDLRVAVPESVAVLKPPELNPFFEAIAARLT